MKKSEKYVTTSHRNRGRYSNALTDARRVICKIEYFPRNVPPQNPSLERSGKKDIELSYNLPPMGRQEHTFGRSLTTLTTVVCIAISHSIGAPMSDGLHRINICFTDAQALLALYTPAPCLRLWIYHPVHCRFQLSYILLCSCPPHG